MSTQIEDARVEFIKKHLDLLDSKQRDQVKSNDFSFLSDDKFIPNKIGQIPDTTNKTALQTDFDNTQKKVNEEGEKDKLMAAAAAVIASMSPGASAELFTGKEAREQLQHNNPSWLEKATSFVKDHVPGAEEPKCMVIRDKDNKELLRYEQDGGKITLRVNPDSKESLLAAFEFGKQIGQNHFTIEKPVEYFGKNKPDQALERFKVLDQALTAHNAKGNDATVTWPNDKEMKEIFDKDEDKMQKAKDIRDKHQKAPEKTEDKKATKAEDKTAKKDTTKKDEATDTKSKKPSDTSKPSTKEKDKEDKDSSSKSSTPTPRPS